MGEALVWGAGLFFVGGLLTLERRCLGAMAVVQPVVICPLVGWLVGDVANGIWFAVVLQLFSLDPDTPADWPLAAVVAGATLAIAPVLGLERALSGAAGIAVVFVAVLSAYGSRAVERRIARLDGEQHLRSSPWTAADTGRALRNLVYRRIGRAVLLGGLQTVVVSAIAVTGAWLVGSHDSAAENLTLISRFFLVVVGVGIAVGAHSGYRHVAAAFGTMAVFLVMLG